jgi:hypothetical protein
MEPPEATSIKSMLNIGGILALIIGIISILVAVWQFIAYLTFSSSVWYYVPGWETGLLIWGIVMIVFAILCFLVYMQAKNISAMIDQRQYIQAKSKTIIWTIIGFIFCWVIVGILFLIAYLKFDDLIRWGQPGQPQPPQQPYYPQQQQYPPQQYPPQQYPPQQPPPPQP